MVCVRLALVLVGALLAVQTAAAAPPVEVYGRLPAVENLVLSPSGDRYALIAVDGDTRKLVVATLDDKPLFGINVGAAKVRSVDWAGEDHVLVTITGTKPLEWYFTVAKSEFAAVISINVATHKIIGVFDKHANVMDSVFGQYGTAQIDGRWYGFFGGLTFAQGTVAGDQQMDHSWSDLYRVDLDTGDLKRIALGGPTLEDWLVGPTGAVLARSTYDDRDHSWQVLSGASGGRLLASGRDQYGGVDLTGLGHTYDTILIRTPSEAGPVDEEVPLAGGEATVIPGNNAVQGALHDRVSHLWIGEIGFGDNPKINMFDPLVNARVAGARAAFPNASATLESWGPGFDRMVMFTSGGDDSGTYWIVDIANHSAHPVGYAYPDVQPADVGSAQMISWKAADGLKINGVLTLPPGRPAKNLPIVVLPHGGPEARDYPAFDWWAQAFASQGYAVLQPNFRGSSGYGQKFIDAGHGEWGRKMQTDLSDGLTDLANQGIVDPKRACIVGASYGGYAALAGVTVQHGLYRCAVADAGVSDLAAMLNYENDRGGGGGSNTATRYWKTFMGPPSGFDQIAPIKLATRADAPILLIHGKDDTVVPYEQSTSMQRALQAAGKPVELVTMPSEDHWLSREATRVMMLKSAVAFVEKYDPPEPPPAAPVTNAANQQAALAK